MGCSSCGGGVAARTVRIENGREIAVPRSVKYVWLWISSDGLEKKEFDSQVDARNWLKSGNPGSLSMQPVR